MLRAIFIENILLPTGRITSRTPRTRGRAGEREKKNLHGCKKNESEKAEARCT